jgi:tetratricopeptide (TPR) repeat protein
MDIGKLTLILRIKMVYLSGESQEKAFKKAIEINPHNSEAWYNKGNSLFYLNKPDEARKAFDKAIGTKNKISDAEAQKLKKYQKDLIFAPYFQHLISLDKLIPNKNSKLKGIIVFEYDLTE